MKRPKDINIVIGIGIFTFSAMTAYWYAWFFAPDVVQARVPSDPDYAVYAEQGTNRRFFFRMRVIWKMPHCPIWIGSSKLV